MQKRAKNCHRQGEHVDMLVLRLHLCGVSHAWLRRRPATVKLGSGVGRILEISKPERVGNMSCRSIEALYFETCQGMPELF